MVGSQTGPNDLRSASCLVLNGTLSSADARQGGIAARPQTKTPSTAVTTRKKKAERKEGMKTSRTPHLKTLSSS
jgi:hypothetical protein